MGTEATQGSDLRAWLGWNLGASRRPGEAGAAGPRTTRGQASTPRASSSARSLRKQLMTGPRDSRVSAGVTFWGALAGDGTGRSSSFR